MTRLMRYGVAGLALVLGGALAGCTANPADELGFAPGTYRLVAFDSCEDALSGLRAAASAVVGPYGFNGAPIAIDNGVTAPRQAPAQGSAPGAGAAAKSATDSIAGGGADSTDYSATNSYEPGADEPDLVKTDGRRIVTVSGGRLKVIDATSKMVVGSVDLTDPARPEVGASYQGVDLLLAGDHALVLLNEAYAYSGPVTKDAVRYPGPVAGPGTRLVLVGLSGRPAVLSQVRVQAGLLDARQSGSVVRVVLRSTPRIDFPTQQNTNDVERLSANQAIIAKTPIDAWLPAIEVTNGDSTTRAQIGCDAISRPAAYSATSVLTVLSFDLTANGLTDGAPVVLVADGNTVYGTGPSLYVTSDLRWKQYPPNVRPTAADVRTEIYKFDTSGPRPVFVAGGAVPGYLVNQYALSEYQGDLRVASTSQTQDGNRTTRQSGVYVLARDGKRLVLKGAVEGLGKGEQIYAVRFAGPVGYVVTFRQTDPLYTVDLSDPTRPAVRGELKIPGYSAYLHPADGTKLIGVGQDGTAQGRVTGAQVSLFDVADLASPTRLASFSLSGAHSEAEFDPHAFLYWPATGLLVIPLQAYGVPTSSPGGPVPGKPAGGASGSGGSTVAGAPTVGRPTIASGALVLRVSGNRIDEVGFVSHPSSPNNPYYAAQIRRSLLIGPTLWTVSDGGLQANDATTLATLAWIPLG